MSEENKSPEENSKPKSAISKNEDTVTAPAAEIPEVQSPENEEIKVTPEETTPPIEPAKIEVKTEESEASPAAEIAEIQIPEKEVKKDSPKEVSEVAVESDDDDDDEAIEDLEEEEEEEDDDEDDTESENTAVIKEVDYTSLNQEKLVTHLAALIKDHSFKKIKNQVEAIKNEFNDQFNTETAQAKESFLTGGGNIIDFHHTSSLKKEFNGLYGAYRKEQKAHFSSVKREQEENLVKREAIVTELKSLFENGKSVRQNYNTFRSLQDQWNEIGHIPRDTYNIVWNNYKHHRDTYYGLMDLDRETRDLDHKFNLDKKLKIILRAQELSKLENVSKAFRELQLLHRIWKDETGPVSREYSEKVWDEFSEYTKIVHDKKDILEAEKEKLYVVNLETKQALIEKINEITEKGAKSHKDWQNGIKEIETLREQFFKSGKVPKSDDKKVWGEFKTATREFNRTKNDFYKGQKDEQYTNLDKKKELIAVAEANKDNDDFEGTINLMKKIQSDWKKIGHVPRKDSDKIWKKFRAACNHFFDRINAGKEEEQKGEVENLDAKKVVLDSLKEVKLSGEHKEDIALIKGKINEWKNIGRVPYKSKGIDQKFNLAIDGLFGQLDMDKKEMEIVKYENRVNTLLSQDDTRALRNEEFFLTKKVEETRNEMLQLQNNLEFFKHVSDDNPMVKDVHKNIAKHKEEFELWKSKLTKLRNLCKPKPAPVATEEESSEDSATE
ncbi:DUF349 domain-containing protein [Patiriisocius sp. Uisw_047]|uniref:DUF349 domain-containing protein n=1 Tax=Patiriisocius sp. Uisw_047 TaxID=3230969 RepID=UPI0039E7D0AF